MKLDKLFKAIIFSALLAPIFALGQNSLLIQNRAKPSKVKALKIKRPYTIKTSEAIFFRSYLLAFTDSAIKSTRRVKYFTRSFNSSANDTSYHTVWREDTFYIPFRDVVYLEKYYFTNRGWLEPFAYFAVGGLGAIVLSPVAAMMGGPEHGIQFLKIGGAILGITVPVIFVGTRKIKYDMRNKWRFNGT